ncbi:CD9 antigen [Merluccius polli]|uniref:Tetraspanin n=1 Tax=Merluccius polli TaxID=89951 RepID=A0AA47NAD7_MERPO|nr:CD9 antigen [Merluccius polli]
MSNIKTTFPTKHEALVKTKVRHASVLPGKGLMGSLVLAVGLWLRFDPETVSLLNGDGAPDTFFIGVYILIVAGSLVMLVGFFGCCGAVRESQCLLGSFFACLLIIFGAEVAAGVFGFLNKDKIIEDVQNFYSNAYNDNNNGTLINSYHKVLNCCGTKTLPCTDLPESKDCEEGIAEFFNSKLYIIGYVGVGIAGVMVSIGP